MYSPVTASCTFHGKQMFHFCVEVYLLCDACVSVCVEGHTHMCILMCACADVHVMFEDRDYIFQNGLPGWGRVQFLFPPVSQSVCGCVMESLSTWYQCIRGPEYQPLGGKSI